jgi:hypothetical protein
VKPEDIFMGNTICRADETRLERACDRAIHEIAKRRDLTPPLALLYLVGAIEVIASGGRVCPGCATAIDSDDPDSAESLCSGCAP